MDQNQGNIHKQAAQEYMAHAEGFLMQALGRDIETKDLAAFVETAGAGLLGSMYAILREQDGKEKSEAWLKKTLQSVSAMARLCGADAMLSFDIRIKNVPNRMTKRDKLQAPQVPQAPINTVPEEIKCTCEVGADGACGTCEGLLSGFLGSSLKSLLEMTKNAKDSESICLACKGKYGDEVVSKLVPDVMKAFVEIEPEPEPRLEKVAAFIVQLAMSLGVQAMPLTQEALKKQVSVGS